MRCRRGRSIPLIPNVAFGLRVEEYSIGDVAIRPIDIIVCSRPLPDDLVLECRWTEHAIQQQLEVVARSRVAVKIQATGRLKYAVEFDQADRHHRQIGHHVVLAEKRTHRVQQVEGPGITAARHLVEAMFGLVVPVPAILEGLYLSMLRVLPGTQPLRWREQNIVAGIRIERGI